MNLSPAFCILFYRNKQKYWRDGTPTKPGEVVLHRQLVRPPEHPGGGGRLPDVVISQDAAPGNLHVLVELPAVEIIPSSNTLTALFSHTFPLSLPHLVEDDTCPAGPEVVEEGMSEAQSLVVIVPGTQSSPNIVNLAGLSLLTSWD